MQPKPNQWAFEHASFFQDESVARAYKYGPTYPPQVFEILAGLIPDSVMLRRVLDVGCGTGLIAREILPYVDYVDAVDLSAAMIATGKKLPAGALAR